MKSKLFLYAALGLAVTSCQQENLEELTGSSNSLSPIQVVEIVNDTYAHVGTSPATKSGEKPELALRFDTEATYKGFLNRLSSLNTEERIKLVKSYGFTSLQEIAVIADKELETFFDTADSNDFIDKYNAYKKKYEGILISNEYNPNDASLYVPDGDNLSTYIVNGGHNVVIGDEVQTLEINNDMGETEKSLFSDIQPMASSQVVDTYHYKKESDGHQTTVDVALYNSGAIKLHIGHQKKKGLWWKRDNGRNTYVDINASLYEFNYTWTNPLGEILFISAPDLYLWHDTGLIDYYIGGLKAGVEVLNNASVLVWTDRTVEVPKTDREILNLVMVDGQLKNSVDVPKRKSSKAYGGTFSLSLNAIN